MPELKHTNRMGKTYYLHRGKTKKGRDKYFFSPRKSGDLPSAIPHGYEIYENYLGQVFLRNTARHLVKNDEIKQVEDALTLYSSLKTYQHRVGSKGNAITVYLMNENIEQIVRMLNPILATDRKEVENIAIQYGSYAPAMRFVLEDKEARTCRPERYCYRGNTDGWISIGTPDSLDILLPDVVGHLGQDSFYDLF